MGDPIGDEITVIVGSYAGQEDSGIHVMVVDEAAATMAPLGSFAGVENPSYVTVRGNRMYCVSETVDGAVHTFEVKDGALLALNRHSVAGDHPCHLDVSADGRWLAASNYSSGNVAVIALRDDGSLGETTAVLQHAGRGVHPHRQAGPHAHSAVFSPDSGWLVAADLGIDRLVVYRVADGGIERHAEVATPAGSGPRHQVFHTGGELLFVVGELDNTLSAFAWDAGSLELIQTVPTVPRDVAGSLAADLHLSPDGAFTYVSNRGHDSIAVFSHVDSGIELGGNVSCGGRRPRGFGVTPSGRHLVVANRDSDEVVLLPVDRSSVGGAVARVSVPHPSSVAFCR